MEDKMGRELLFSITKKDFDIQSFRSGGNGGQKVDKTSSAVRFIHKESGAIGVARDSRKKSINTKKAFLRCVESKKFQAWLKIEIAEHIISEEEKEHIQKAIENMVKAWLDPKNIKTEYI